MNRVGHAGLLPLLLAGCFLAHGREERRREDVPEVDELECPPDPSPARIVAVAGRDVWFVDARGRARVVHRFEGRSDVMQSSGTSSVASDGGHVAVTQAASGAASQGQGNAELVVLCTDGRTLTTRTLQDVPYTNALRAQAFVREGRVVMTYGSHQSAHAIVLLEGSEHSWTAPFNVVSAPDADGTLLAVARGNSAVAFHWVEVDGSDAPTRYLSAGAGTPKLLQDGLVWPAPAERRLYVETVSALRAIELPTLQVTHYAHSGIEPVAGGWVMYRDADACLHRAHAPSGRVRPGVKLELPDGLQYTQREPEIAIDAQGRIFAMLRNDAGAALFLTDDGSAWTRASPWHTGTGEVHAREAAGTYLVWGKDPGRVGTGDWRGRPTDEPVREGQAYEVVRPDEDIYWPLPLAWPSGQVPTTRYQLASDGRAVSFWLEDQLFMLDVETGEVIATELTYSTPGSPIETYSPTKVSTFVPGQDVWL